MKGPDAWRYKDTPYLTIPNIGDKLPLPVVITETYIRKLWGQPRLILVFAGLDRHLKLGNSNNQTLCNLWGHDIHQWTGKRILLEPASFTDQNGKLVEWIKIKPMEGKVLSGKFR